MSQVLKVVNEHGLMFEMALDIMIPFDTKLAYCDQRTPNLLPEIISVYLIEVHPRCIAANALWLNREDNVYPNMFGLDKIHLVRTITFLKLFVRWLIQYGFTDASLEVKSVPTIEASHLKSLDAGNTN